MCTENIVKSREDYQYEGRIAYHNGEDDDSPYLAGSDEADFWREGYKEAKEESE